MQIYFFILYFNLTSVRDLSSSLANERASKPNSFETVADLSSS